MLDEKEVTAFVEKLRATSGEKALEILQLLAAARDEDAKEAAAEIAKTVCEILEPERGGTIHWILCKTCGERLIAAHRDRGFCAACYG